MTIYTPYTYLIGWSFLNLWYYGVRFAKKCHPSELCVTYFTSSEYVQRIRLEYGEPDLVQIRRTFLDSQSARLWETNVLKRMKVVNDPKWINKTDNISIQAMPGELNPNYRKDGNKGYKHTIEHLIYISQKFTGRTLTKEHRLNISKSKIGGHQTKETIQKRSEKNEKSIL